MPDIGTLGYALAAFFLILTVLLVTSWRGRLYGNMQVVTWDKQANTVSAASDPRGEGKALQQ